VSAPKASLAITLVRSVISTPRNQRVVVRGLGLRRMQQTVVHPDTAIIRGMVDKVRHLLSVKQVEAKHASK
jgi:large subunit ribosomal protein L30